MSDFLAAVLACAVLFAVFGVYGLLSNRGSCSGSCTGCASSAACGHSNPRDELVQIEPRRQG